MISSKDKQQWQHHHQLYSTEFIFGYKSIGNQVWNSYTLILYLTRKSLILAQILINWIHGNDLKWWIELLWRLMSILKFAGC